MATTGDSSIVYILLMSCFAPALFFNIRFDREEEGYKGKHLDLDEIKCLLCKYPKKWDL